MDGSALTGFCLSHCQPHDHHSVSQSLESMFEKPMLENIDSPFLGKQEAIYKKSNRLAKHGIWVRSISCSQQPQRRSEAGVASLLAG